MKKLLILLAAVAALALGPVPRAGAWKEFRFGSGVEVQSRGGGNRLLWGLWDGSSYPPGGSDGGMGWVPYSPLSNAGYGGLPWFRPYALPVSPPTGPGGAGAGQPGGPPPYSPGGYSQYADYYRSGLFSPYAAPGWGVPSYWYGY